MRRRKWKPEQKALIEEFAGDTKPLSWLDISITAAIHVRNLPRRYQCPTALGDPRQPRNYCPSIGGRLSSRPSARNTVFHSYCLGTSAEFLQVEEKPVVRGIPRSLRDRFGDAKLHELI
jgi:hypothetical protein